MPHKPLPLFRHPWHQENLIWYAAESDGALGRKSLQGAIQARLEGSAGGFTTADILLDPETALDEVVERVSFRAAGRVKRIERALAQISAEKQQYLAAVYFVPPQVGLEAWDDLANLVCFSSLAQKKYRQARVKMTFGEWVMRLSGRKLGVLGRDRVRSKPKATRSELSLISKIDKEITEMLADALEDYVEAARRVGTGSLIERVRRRYA